jgi:hypothetical protein
MDGKEWNGDQTGLLKRVGGFASGAHEVYLGNSAFSKATANCGQYAGDI